MLLSGVIVTYTIVSIKACPVSGARNIDQQICCAGCVSAQSKYKGIN